LIPNYVDPNSKLAKLWDTNLSQLLSEPPKVVPPEIAERHSIYCLMLMALTRHYWNGNKRGERDGDYSWRQSQRRADGTYLGDKVSGRYLGHNIAAIAVDEAGFVIDFDFNHNALFNSSVEHAEARLITRLFKLNSVYDAWRVAVEPRKYASDLSKVTVYTTLESCAQCSGIMALARIPTVVFVQPDPGQYMIGNLIKALSDVDAPEPIAASNFQFAAADALTNAYINYAANVSEAKPFFKPNDGSKADVSKAITSFLCNDDALEVFSQASQTFVNFNLKFPNFKPAVQALTESAMNNAEVFAHLKTFLEYASKSAKRGTPH
jgi:tRNA(Arg) A34 adenosine deaminase TadA